MHVLQSILSKNHFINTLFTPKRSSIFLQSQTVRKCHITKNRITSKAKGAIRIVHAMAHNTKNKNTKYTPF